VPSKSSAAEDAGSSSEDEVDWKEEMLHVLDGTGSVTMERR